MGNLGGGEILIILVVALVVLGPGRLPTAARQVGNAIGELKRLSSGFQNEMKAAMDDVSLSSTTSDADDVTQPAEQAESGEVQRRERSRRLVTGTAVGAETDSTAEDLGVRNGFDPSETTPPATDEHLTGTGTQLDRSEGDEPAGPGSGETLHPESIESDPSS